MKKYSYYNGHNIPLAFSNMLPFTGGTVDEITDVIEDATTAKELLYGIEKLRNEQKISPWRRFLLDRETESYVRLKFVDKLGNVEYIKAYK